MYSLGQCEHTDLVGVINCNQQDYSDLWQLIAIVYLIPYDYRLNSAQNSRLLWNNIFLFLYLLLL